MTAHGSTHRMTIGSLFLALALTACTNWQVQQASPELVAGKHPKWVRVQRSDRGRPVLLGWPRVARDSLVGRLYGNHAGVPLADISQLAVPRLDLAKTIGLFFGTYVGLRVLVDVLSSPPPRGGGGGPYGGWDYPFMSVGSLPTY